VVSDLDRRCVVEVPDGRSRRRVGRYLRSLPEQTRRAIELVSIDPCPSRAAQAIECPRSRVNSREALRCLKRHISRELYHRLTDTPLTS
jgi:transposase